MNLKMCSVSPHGDTGMAYYDYTFCQALSEAGLQVTLFTSRPWPLENMDVCTTNRKILDNKRPILPLTSAKKLLNDGKVRDYPSFFKIILRKAGMTASSPIGKEKVNNKNNFVIKKYFLGVYETAERSARLTNYLWGLWKIFSYAFKEKIRIIHFQAFAFPAIDLIFVGWLKIWRIKVVYSPHDINALKVKAGSELIGDLFDLVDVIVVHSVANKVLLIKEFDIEHDRIKIIQQGNYSAFLNPELTKVQAREKLGLPQDKKIILLFGHLRKDKGITTGVKALKLLKDKKSLLLIAGKPHPQFDADSLRREIGMPELKERVVLRDQWIEDSLVEYYYKSADVVVLPYDASYTSAVLIYAFSCGVPAIISNISELTEFVIEGENALIFPAGESAVLAEKIEQLLRNPALAQKLAVSAKNVADNEWKWETTAQAQKKIYEELFSMYFPRSG